MAEVTFKKITCPKCKGSGELSEDTSWGCFVCFGSGKVTIKIEPEPTDEEWSKGEE